MATITFRLSEAQKAELELAAASAGRPISDYIRQTLDLQARVRLDGLAEHLEALTRRVDQLEQIAGL